MTSFTSSTTTKEALAELVSMHQTMRPAGSQTEAKFIDTYLRPLGVREDGYGNLILRVGDVPVLWSSHTDTVHWHGGLAPVIVDDKNVLRRHPKSKASCLGADDTAGIWMMTQMIRAERPGLYVFHRAEECGGKGSKWLAKNTPELLKDIQYAIAFDRKGKDSIITHQFGGRCCSEEFSKSLGVKLGGRFKSDRGGSFTDTASYVDLIGECTNLSVGYDSQHSTSESLDLDFISDLRDVMVTLDASDLVVKRKPGEREPHTPYRYNSGWRGNGGSADFWDGYDDGGYYRTHHWDHKTQTYVPNTPVNTTHDKSKSTAVVKTEKKASTRPEDVYEYFRRVRGVEVRDSFLALVQDYPFQIAKMLEDSGYKIGHLHKMIQHRGGILTTILVPKVPDDKKSSL